MRHSYIDRRDKWVSLWSNGGIYALWLLCYGPRPSSAYDPSKNDACFLISQTQRHDRSALVRLSCFIDEDVCKQTFEFQTSQRERCFQSRNNDPWISYIVCCRCNETSFVLHKTIFLCHFTHRCYFPIFIINSQHFWSLMPSNFGYVFIKMSFNIFISCPTIKKLFSIF